MIQKISTKNLKGRVEDIEPDSIEPYFNKLVDAMRKVSGQEPVLMTPDTAYYTLSQNPRVVAATRAYHVDNSTISLYVKRYVYDYVERKGEDILEFGVASPSEKESRAICVALNSEFKHMRKPAVRPSL